MKRRGWSFRGSGGKAFAVDNNRLNVFRIFSNHVWEVKDPWARATIRLQSDEISDETACAISRFKGDLESTLNSASYSGSANAKEEAPKD